MMTQDVYFETDYAVRVLLLNPNLFDQLLDNYRFVREMSVTMICSGELLSTLLSQINIHN